MEMSRAFYSSVGQRPAQSWKPGFTCRLLLCSGAADLPELKACAPCLAEVLQAPSRILVACQCDAPGGCEREVKVDKYEGDVGVCRDCLDDTCKCCSCFYHKCLSDRRIYVGQSLMARVAKSTFLKTSFIVVLIASFISQALRLRISKLGVLWWRPVFL